MSHTYIHIVLHTQLGEKIGFYPPDRQFVLLSAWDENDGPLDSTKIEDQVIDGVVKKGIFKQAGRHGGFTEKSSSEKGFRQVRYEADYMGLWGA